MLQLKPLITFVPDMNNTRFATVIHILTILAEYGNDWVSSEWIAGSININPVIVRKELGVLQSVGYVTGRKGKEGGYRLNKPEQEISLADLYLVVKNSDVLGKKNMHTNPRCPIGKDINNKLEELFSETDQAVINSLKGKTLESFAKQFH